MSIELKMTVQTEAQAKELNEAWLEILSGKVTRLNAAAVEVDEIMERAMTALEVIVKAIREGRDTGQGRRLVRFVAGLYNGNDYHFDLTDLRSLDTELANACVDYLNYDRLSKAEVHNHVPGGGPQVEQWFDDVGIVPRPRLDERTQQAHRLWALSERRGPNPNELLRAAVEDLLSTYERRAFKAMIASKTGPYNDARPLTHACMFEQLPPHKPLCGAGDGPWQVGGFQFRELTCDDCVAEVLKDAKRIVATG
jgi:hypothetical protein